MQALLLHIRLSMLRNLNFIPIGISTTRRIEYEHTSSCGENIATISTTRLLLCMSYRLLSFVSTSLCISFVISTVHHYEIDFPPIG